MTTAEIIPPGLSKAHLAALPGADSRCKLCKLDIEDIEYLNRLRFEEKYTYDKIARHVKKRFGFKFKSESIGLHFKMHAMEAKALVKAQTEFPEIVGALHPIEKTIQVEVDQDIEQAYRMLVQMAHQYTTKIKELQDEAAKIIQAKDLKLELEGLSAIELLERIARLNREAREQIKDISAIRAPKVMVAQLIENYMNVIIREVSKVLSQLCGELYYEIQENTRGTDFQAMVPKEVFEDLFARVGQHYKDRVMAVKRQQLADALAALKDMEKIV
jgi:hypothetical protein